MVRTGRRPAPEARRAAVEECERLHILPKNCRRQEPGAEGVELAYTDQRPGCGRRAWFACPGCRRRARDLYRAPG